MDEQNKTFVNAWELLESLATRISTMHVTKEEMKAFENSLFDRVQALEELIGDIEQILDHINGEEEIENGSDDNDE